LDLKMLILSTTGAENQRRNSLWRNPLIFHGSFFFS
jgi:hypothetical protein